MHIETRLTVKRSAHYSFYWDNKTVRDLSVTVLPTKEHCLLYGGRYPSSLMMGVVSSCLETLCVMAVVAETGLLACRADGPHTLLVCVGVSVDLQLASVPKLRQLL